MSVGSWARGITEIDVRSRLSVVRSWAPAVIAGVLLLLGILLTWFWMRSTEQSAIDRSLQTLEENAARSEGIITERLLACEAVLRAASGFVENAWPFDNEQWSRFIRPLRQSFAARGIQGVGFAAVVDGAEFYSDETPSRDVRSAAVEQGDLRTVILFLEPQDPRSVRAVGFDMASESRRRAAMELARDSGAAAISARVTLIQEIDQDAHPGFLMYVPVYAQHRPMESVQERRRALVGYVFGPFKANDFLEKVFEQGPKEVRIEVYDGDRPSLTSRLYVHGPAVSGASLPSVVRHISVAGHRWTLRVTATAGLLNASQKVPDGMVWLNGALGTALLCGMAFALARSRQTLRERLAADERLIEQQRDAAAMLENSMDGFIVIDKHDRILEWNKQAVQMFGWSRAEAIGRQLGDLIVPERLRAAHEEAISNFHHREHTLLGKRVDQPAVRRDGTELLVSLSIMSVQRRDEAVFFASIRDITAKRHQEAQVQRLNATLEHRVSERTQELERAHQQLQVAYRDLEAFTRSVSHDLRAPLRAIRGYSALLLQQHGLDLSPAGIRDAEMISSTAERMNAILDNLLKLASVSQSELKTQEQSLAALVRQVVDELKPGFKGQIDVDDERLGCVCADPGLLLLALRNLISNAIKFSSRAEKPLIQIGATERDGERICFVRDNGVGFDCRYINRLFGAFQRLHSAQEFEGTGLGLTIVKSAIEKNRGRVWAESSVGAGATFYFALPACRQVNTRALK